MGTDANEHDWSRFDALTEAEVHAAALADPEAQPLTEEHLARMKRVPRARTLRRALGLTQEEFAARYHIPIGTLRDWEQGARSPISPRAPISTLSRTIPTACAARWKPARSSRRARNLARAGWIETCVGLAPTLMILPLMGLLMVGIPAAGFFFGVVLLCIRELRFLAPFAFFMPLFGSYAAIAGFWGGAIVLEHTGILANVPGVIGLVCVFLLTSAAGILGSLAAYKMIRIILNYRLGAAR